MGIQLFDVNGGRWREMAGNRGKCCELLLLRGGGARSAPEPLGVSWR